MAEKVLVTYHCKQTKQTVKVEKGTGQEYTLKKHKQWEPGPLPTTVKTEK